MKSSMRNRHGCVIAFKGRILCRGHNAMCVRGATRFCHSCHAKIAALRQLVCTKRGLIMIVTQVNRENQTKQSHPCSVCTREILKCRQIKKVFFTIDK